METILVTGGLGYIGSSLLKDLQKNYRLICIDDCKFNNFKIRNKLSKKITYFKNSISNERILKKIFKNFSIKKVIHLAAIVGEPACNKDPKYSYDINYNSSKKIFDLSVKYKVNQFIFVSTCSNYGKNKKSFVNEKSKLLPLSPYSHAKVNFEKYLMKNKSKIGNISMLRLATVFGLSYRQRFDLTINEFVRDIFYKKKLEVYGENFWRPYVHVADIVNFIILILNRNKKGTDVVNVGKTENNFTKKMIVKKISKYLDIDNVSFNNRKIVDNRDYKVNFDKILKKYNYKIKFNLDYGIKEIISFLKKSKKKDVFSKDTVNS